MMQFALEHPILITILVLAVIWAVVTMVRGYEPYTFDTDDWNGRSRPVKKRSRSRFHDEIMK